MLRPHRRFLAIQLLLVTTGCCPLTQFFCGPDKSPWVSKSYATAQQAIETFLEAIRRDDTREIYRSLSESFKEKEGLPGALEFELAWHQLRQRYGYIHMLGTAEPHSVGPRREFYRDFDLELAGRHFHAVLHRQNYLSLHYEAEELAEPLAEGRYVESLTPYLHVLSATGGGTTIQLNLPGFDVEELQASELTRAAIGREWKIESLREESDVDG